MTMKQMRLFRRTVILLMATIAFGACHNHQDYHIHDIGPGPHGRDGFAFLAIDYTWSHPYSYWDDNPDIPYNPLIGHAHQTFPGIYEFEYFIDPWEYWYGTYEIWINLGGPGGPHGEPGFDGADNYFTLFCDPDGFWMDLESGFYKKDASDEIVIEKQDENVTMRITMKKAHVKDRKAHEPKVIWGENASPKVQK